MVQMQKSNQETYTHEELRGDARRTVAVSEINDGDKHQHTA
jgi:hypothetical protein